MLLTIKTDGQTFGYNFRRAPTGIVHICDGGVVICGCYPCRILRTKVAGSVIPVRAPLCGRCFRILTGTVIEDGIARDANYWTTAPEVPTN